MRKISYLLILLLLVTNIVLPIVNPADIPRHLDPATLPQENPDQNKLFNLYYNIFHETAKENFTGANLWLSKANKVEALPNLKPNLQTYYNTTQSELIAISDARSLIDEIQIMLKRLDPDTPTAIKNALNMLNKATKTLDDINSQSQTMGKTLQYPTTQLDNGLAELRQLLNEYNEQLNTYSHSIETDLNANKPKLFIYTDKNEIMPGEILLIQGNLNDKNGTELPGRKINLYFNDTKIASITTTEFGGIKAEFPIPYLYKDNATIYAEYKPEGADTTKYGRTISNIIIIKILWIQPTLTIQVPDKAYPGTELRITGLLSYKNVGLVGVNITVTVFGDTNSKETSRKGSFTTISTVPENYPEITQQVLVQSQAAGIYCPATARGTVVVTRYPSKLMVDSPNWIFIGQKLIINGKMESQNHSIQNTLIELRSTAGKTTTNVNIDGTFTTENILPLTLLTTTCTYQVFAHPSPWIREASATGSVLVINPLTLLLVLALVGTLTFQLSKRIHIKPSTKTIVTPPKGAETIPPKPNAEPLISKVTEPDNPKDLFWWTTTHILSNFNIALSKNMTIREWLYSLKGKTDTPLYILIERIGIQYERTLYGKKPQDEQETKTLYQKIRELLR